LNPGNRIPGAAIVWTPITTLVIGPRQSAHVDAYKNIVVTSVG
jgi:N-methylhydantoinase A/oxoprolinase/acetone carboxylase beta subunit